MSTVTGTLTGVQLVSASPEGVGARKVYLLTYNFGAYTGASDSGTVTGVAAAISSHVRNGKTNAMIAGVIPFCAFPGQDTNGQAIYIGTTTISTNDLTFNLTDAAQTEVTTSTATLSPVGLLVAVTES